MKPRCGANKTDGSGPCQQPAGWGTDHNGTGPCKKHGGNTATHRKAGQQAAAERAVATLGLPVEVNPHEALLEEVHRTAGHVRWLAEVVADTEKADLVWGLESETHKGATEFPGTDTTRAAKPSVWLELYHRERAHLVRVAKAAIDAGIDERRVQLAEQQGELVVQVIRATLNDLGVDVTEEVASTVGRHLRAVA